MERAEGLSSGAPRWHAGSCHCGRVRIEALAPPDLDVLECNCSMCSRSAYLHLIVAAGEFRLLSGADALVEYSFGTGVAKHRFCRHCGVKSFYVPRSHPDGYSVNARCLDPATISSMRIRSFDGRDWEAARMELDAR
jgi:hypothetical protein